MRWKIGQEVRETVETLAVTVMVTVSVVTDHQLMAALMFLSWLIYRPHP